MTTPPEDLACFVNDLLRRYGLERPINRVDVFTQSLRHRSCNYKESFERLEFLGDSVVGMIVSAYLYDRYPGQNEGFLSTLKSKIVSGRMLCRFCRCAGIPRYVKMSDEAEIKYGRDNDKILEDAFEAFIGAMYLDVGFECTRLWFVNFMERHIDFVDLITDQKHNYKDMLVKHIQKVKTHEIAFKQIEKDDSGFKVVIQSTDNGQILAVGVGSCRRDAENDAAYKCLQTLPTVGRLR